MRLSLTLAAGLALLAAPSLAQTAVYAFESKQNFCPAGLQPVTISGTICCGVPNKPQSYQQAMRHPVAKHYSHRTVMRARTCPEGVKGCF
jgi:hypothetical protein